MLARTLGRTLDELGDSMSAAEFLDHWDDYQRDPWGGLRDDLNTAHITKSIANYAGKMRKDSLEYRDAVDVLRYETDKLLNPQEHEAPEKEIDPATFLATIHK